MIIDLTHTISEDMPVFKGAKQPKLINVAWYDADFYRETEIDIYSHTGTHVDAPSHILKEGRTLDMFPIEHFMGKAVVIDCRDIQDGHFVTLESLMRYKAFLGNVDYLLFNFGWDKKWKTNDYFGKYPCIDSDVLDFVIKGKYKGIGFDTISLDPLDNGQIERHKKLFSERDDIIVIENLKNLDLCGKDVFDFAVFPLKIEGGDGSPARAVAIL